MGGALPDAGRTGLARRLLSAADQWQGRALHPIRSARMGLWHSLSTLRGTHRDAAAVDASLQLASPTSRHRRDRTHESPQPDQKQPVDASQLTILGVLGNILQARTGLE